MQVNIGDKIRKVRKLKGYTQDYMADKLEMSQRAYSKIENNEIKLVWERIDQISKIMQIEPIDLVSFDVSLVFTNSLQSRKSNLIHNNNFSTELKKSYEDRIAHLENEVLFLRGMLEKN